MVAVPLELVEGSFTCMLTRTVQAPSLTISFSIRLRLGRARFETIASCQVLYTIATTLTEEPSSAVTSRSRFLEARVTVTAIHLFMIAYQSLRPDL